MFGVCLHITQHAAQLARHCCMHILSRDNFKRLHCDVSSWMGWCEKWVRKLWYDEFRGGCIWVKGREEVITAVAVSSMLLSCRFLSLHPHQLLSLLCRPFASSCFFFFQTRHLSLSSSFSLSLPILGLYKLFAKNQSLWDSLPNSSSLPKCACQPFSNNRLLGFTHRQENRSVQCSCLSLTGGTFPSTTDELPLFSSLIWARTSTVSWFWFGDFRISPPFSRTVTSPRFLVWRGRQIGKAA